MAKHIKEIWLGIRSLVFSALYSFFYEENIIGFLINLVFFYLVLKLIAYLLSKRKFTMSVLLVLIIPLGLIGAKSVVNTTNFKDRTYNGITYYYTNNKQWDAIETIEKNVKPYSTIASNYFDNGLFQSNVKVYLSTARKDIRLRSVVGYYDGEKIVLRAEKAKTVNVTESGGLDLTLPFFHEYTHYLIRNTTTKKLPMWFSEGLAEYIARQATNHGERLANPLQFKVVEDDSNWDQYNLGWIYQSSRFYIEEIIELWGEGAISNTLDNLTKGTEFVPALEKGIGLPYDEIIRELEGQDFR